MRRSDLTENLSVFYIGKSIIILSLVLTSSLSFILGFLVGKGMRSPGIEQAPVVTPLMNTGQEKRGTEMKEASAQQPQQTKEGPTAEAQKTPEALETPKQENSQEDPGIEKIHQPQETKHNRESTRIREDEKASKEGESKPSRTTHEPSAKVRYTVQIGAFKSASDADSLKSKFGKKGYKSFIKAPKRKDEKLYKVMIGEFHRRKDAELLSVKMKKTEGLKTFVTLDTD
jgi:cell division protein FtsN